MPFKDKLQKLAYGRKYQAKNREKLKELEELHDIEAQVVKIVRDCLVGRRLFGIEQLPNSGVQKPLKGEFISHIPVINTDIQLSVTPRNIEDAALRMVEQEDKLLLVGDHKGWPAFGLQGLATAKGRNIIKSCGNFEDDLKEGTKRLKKCGQLPPYSVITSRGYSVASHGGRLNWDGLPDSDFLISTSLYSQEGTQDNMLVVKPNQTNFVLLMGQDLSVCRLKNGGYKLWEVLAPKICEPTAICEIQGVR